MRYFDSKKLAREAASASPTSLVPSGVGSRWWPPLFAFVIRHWSSPPAQLARLCKMIRKDFPADDMMYELHVLRACMAVRDGYAKIEDILPATPVVATSRR